MKKIFAVILLCVFWGNLKMAVAAVSDYADIFAVNLEEDVLPQMHELDAVLEKYDEYHRNYNSFYDLQGNFDDKFYATLQNYGKAEKRLKPQDEEMFLEMISMFPKNFGCPLSK